MAVYESNVGDAGLRSAAQPLACQTARFEFIIVSVVWCYILRKLNIISSGVKFISECRENCFDLATITTKGLAKTLKTDADCSDTIRRWRKSEEQNNSFKGTFLISQLILLFILQKSGWPVLLENHKVIWGFLYDLSLHTLPTKSDIMKVRIHCSLNGKIYKLL